MMSSDFLYATPKFITGVARILDFGRTLNEYNTSDSENEADLNALYSDWSMTGQDIQGAIDEYREKSRENWREQ